VEEKLTFNKRKKRLPNPFTYEHQHILTMQMKLGTYIDVKELTYCL